MSAARVVKPFPDAPGHGGGDVDGPMPEPFMLTCAVMLEALDRMHARDVAVLGRMLLAALEVDARHAGGLGALGRRRGADTGPALLDDDLDQPGAGR